MYIDGEFEALCEVTRRRTVEETKRLNDLHDYFERIGADSSRGSPVGNYLDNLCRSITINARLDANIALHAYAYHNTVAYTIPHLVVDRNPSMTFRQFVCHLQQWMRCPLRHISNYIMERDFVFLYNWKDTGHAFYLRNKNRKMKDVIFRALDIDDSEDTTGMIQLTAFFLGYSKPATVTFHF